MTHELKCWPEYFGKIRQRKKGFEVRKDDRNFQVGDTLILKEWDNENQAYTGDWCERIITYILKGGRFGIQEGFVVMSLI